MLTWLLFWRKRHTPKLPAAAPPTTDQEALLVRGQLWRNTAAHAPCATRPGDVAVTNAVKRLIGQLAHRDAAARRGAAVELGRMGDQAEAAVPALVKAAVGMETALRPAATKALMQIVSRWDADKRLSVVGPALIAELENASAAVRQRSADRLVRIGAPAVPYLLLSLADYTNEALQIAVAQTLGRMGAAAASAVPALTRELRSSEFPVRQVVAEALGGIGPAAGAALTGLTVALTDWHPLVRRSAALALARIGSGASRAVPALIQLLTDRDQVVREAAVEALAQLGPVAVALLVDTLVERDRSRAREKLRQLLQVSAWFDGPPADDFEAEQQHTLRKAEWCWRNAVDDDLWLAMLHLAVLRVLGKIGTPAAAAVGPITAFLADPSSRVRCTAVSALGQIGAPSKSVLPTLARALMDDAEPVRKATAEALAQIDANWASPPEMQDVLARLAVDLKTIGPRGTMSVEAMIAAGAAAVPVLTRALRSDDRIEREKAATTLGRIGPRAEAAIPALQQALLDSHGWVRDAAAKALQQIAPSAEKQENG